MCVPGALPPFGAAHLLPSMRSPVPQSRMICVPSGAISSRQGVFPPYRHVAGSTVGVDPRTPQKLNLAMGTVIALRAKPLCEGSLRANTHGTLSSFHGRSRRKERQSITKDWVSYCLISAGKGCKPFIERVEWCGWPLIPILMNTVTPVIRIPLTTVTPATPIPRCDLLYLAGPWLPLLVWL